jgi:hypothetical protein
VLASGRACIDTPAATQHLVLELRVLEAKENLCDEQVKLADLQLAEAKKTCDANSDHALKLALLELKIVAAKAEYDKSNVQLELALKRCSVSDGDEKASCQALVQDCKERRRVAMESLGWAHDEKKNILMQTREAGFTTNLESAAAGTKRKASHMGNGGGCKISRSSSLNQVDSIPAWQWRHADGTWMSYSNGDSMLIDDARNRRESTCIVTVDGVEFVIDLERMEQRRANAGSEASGSSSGPAQDACRPIRPWLEEWSEDSMLQWNAHIREVYPSWDAQTSEVQSCAVEPGTNDYRKVEGLLFDGSGRLSEETHEICRVLRFQNLWTLSRYENEKKAISRKRNGGEC